MRAGPKFRLGDLCSITKGDTPIKKAISGGYPMVVTAAERRTHNTFQFDCRAVVVPLVSSTGHGHASIKRIHYQEGKFALGSILCAVVPKDEQTLNPLFLHIYFSYFKDQLIVPLMKGTANVSLSVGALEDLEIIVPPMEVQDRVINLTRNDALMKHLEDEITHQQSLLANLKQAILLDAITGKLTANWRAEVPDTEPASQLLQRISDHRVAEYEAALLKAKKLGHRKPKKLRGLVPPVAYQIPEWSELPASWAPTVIDKIGLVCVGATPDRSRKEYWGGGIPWVSSGEVANCYIEDTKEKISADGFGQASVTMHPPGTVLVAMIGQGKTRGQSAILNIAACTNQNSASVIIDHGLIVPEFLWLIFLARYEESREAAKGGNQPALNGRIVGSIPVRLPPLAEQSAIVERVDALMAACSSLEKEIGGSHANSGHLVQAILKEAFAHTG